MAIESAAHFRRLARTILSVLVGTLSLCGVAMAQNQLVTTGSIIPLQHSTSYQQIYKIDIAPNGDTLFLDPAAGTGALYDLKAGTTTFETITDSISPSGDTYYNEGMTLDAVGNMYLTARYGTTTLYRVPYNNGNYQFSASQDAWEQNLETSGTQNVYFLNSAARDGSGLLFVSEQANYNLLVIPVNADGTVPLIATGANAGQPEYTYIIKGLKDKIMPMVADVNGNIYFIENPYEAGNLRTTGVFFIPASAYQSCLAAVAAGTGLPSTPCISGTESSLSRIDPGNAAPYDGITLDAAGNVYVGENANTAYSIVTPGLYEIPNESGSPIGVTASSFVFADTKYISAVPVNANPTIDPRGFIWLPTGGATDYSPNGSGPIPGTGNLVLYALGTDNLGAALENTPSATGTVFFSFSGSVSPASIALSQPGGGAEFSAVTTNPYPPTAGTTPAVPCAATTAGVQNIYIDNSSCEYWVALTPQGTNSVGNISGQLSMLDGSNNVIPGSATYLTGVGEGPAAALLVPANQTPLATGLSSPQQVAGDSLGNSYVADSGLGQVLEFKVGSTTASSGTPISSGFTAPTGVAVDGSGDVYVADSGKVLEVPAVNGVLNPTAKPVTIASGLGSNVNLAVDGAGNVYAADPTNARVVKIYNPQMSMVIENTSTVGTGFTKPTAVAVDDSGNVYVADGSNLDEINFWGGQTTVTSSLSAPVTGLVVDPSGSVDVAQAGGIIRIPFETSSTSAALNFNDAAAIDSTGITAPNSVGMDSLGNLYATAASYNVTNYTASSAPTTATVTTPNVLSLNGAFDSFGLQSTQTQSDPSDVDVYNIGNEPLSFTANTTNPTFAGPNMNDYSIETDGENPCDTTGATPIASATACSLGVTVTPANNGLSQATMSVLTNAVNAPTTTAVLEAYAEDNLCLTTTTITLTPAANLSYPASTTVAVATNPVNPACSAGNVPSGGKVVLTLAPQAKGSSQTTQTLTLSNGSASFNVTGLNGGTYILFASYKGDAIFGGSSSSRTFSFVVAQAQPTVVLNEPAGVTPTNGTYYVQQGSTTTIQASVTSSVGSPSGNVQFLNNGSTPADPTQNPVTLDGSGNATLNTSNLAAGTYNLTAVYGGDVNFASVTSSVVTIVVVPPSALITASPAAVSTTAGTPVTSTLTITALEGYSPQLGVQLYCAPNSLPTYAECTFDVPTVDIFDHPGVPQISHVTISSNLPVNVSAVRTGKSPIAFAGIFGLSLVGLALRRRGKLNRSPLTLICLMLLFGGSLVGLSGCTNSGYSHAPPAPQVTSPSGTYNVSIYAVDLSSGLTTSLPFTLSLTMKPAGQ